MRGTMELADQVFEALKPRGVKERLKIRATGGLTVSQVFDRLPSGTRNALTEHIENPVVARREALDQVVRAIFVHIDRGDVRRKRTRVKNAARAGIDAMVDVYRIC